MAIVNVQGQTGGGGINYATGTFSVAYDASGVRTMTVSDLGFRPYALVAVRSVTPASYYVYGVCNADKEVVLFYNLNAGGSWSPGDDGFSVSMPTAGATQTWTWYVVGG